MARDPYNPNIRQVPLQQQQQPQPPYLSSPQPGPDLPETKPGQPPSDTFVVTTYDARPLNAYDGFWVLRDEGFEPPGLPPALGTGFITPPGYTIIIRQLDITLYPHATPTSLLGLVDLWGQPLWGDFDTQINFQYQIMLNGIPSPQLSSIPVGVPPITVENSGKVPIAAAMLGTLTVPTFIIVPENTTVRTLTTFTGQGSWEGTWSCITVMSYNLLLNTGVDPQSEPVNKLPVPVTVR